MEHHHKRKRNKNMAGKLITILQLILSAGLLILVWNSGMVRDCIWRFWAEDCCFYSQSPSACSMRKARSNMPVWLSVS